MDVSLVTSGPLLVFDGDCAFCTTSVLWLQRQFPDAFAMSPYQRTDLTALGLTPEECHAKVQWLGDVRDPVGSRLQGHLAVAALVREGGRTIGGLRGGLWRAAGVVASVPPVSWVSAGVYSWVAANRQRLPGGTPACAM
jgi:predicted DCC family thiol-disulfide oxidoreductase YuxK